MRKIAATLCATIVVSWALTIPLSSRSQEIETQVPEFKLKTPEGKEMSLKEHLAKGPVLLNFWTTWCKPCQKELPELQKLFDKYKEKGFTLFAISEDDQRTQARVRPTVRTRGYKFPVLVDPDHKVGNLFGVRNYPTNVLIAPDGKIAVTSEGYRKGDEKKMEAQIVKLLEASADKATEESEGGDES